ncbi:MAG: hypothetical protein HY835_05625 [Anaerolineae bacterium]|nr:hypothetical protein [Anaerolineae bacterium]
MSLFSSEKLVLLEEYINSRVTLFITRLNEIDRWEDRYYRYQLKTEIELMEVYLSWFTNMKSKYSNFAQNGIPEQEIDLLVSGISLSIQSAEFERSRASDDYQIEALEGELSENYSLRKFIMNLRKD